MTLRRMAASGRMAVTAVAALLLGGCAGLQRGEERSGEIVLFDGTSLDGWRQAGPGRFVLQPDGSMLSEGGMGLFYYEQPFRDFVLELDYRTDVPNANSGVFLRFPTAPTDPWEAVESGYEVQIGPSSDALRTTGAVYTFSAPTQLIARPAGEWNRYRIEVTGQRYRIWLNGRMINDFVGDRGREGYIGIQNHDNESRVRFRNVRITPLRPANPPERLGDLFTVEEEREPIRVLMVTATHGFRHRDGIESAKALMTELGRTTELQVEITEDLEALEPRNLANFDVLFFSNSTLRAEPGDPADSAAVEMTRTADVANPVTLLQQRAIIEFVREGKGVVAAHAGLDAFFGWEEYREMMGGGLFESHPWSQHVRFNVEEPSNPSVSHLGIEFGLRDEIYVLDENPRWNSRVLVSLDMQSVGVEGYADATGGDHPISWIRRFGEGRVFATALGHFGDVWRNPAFAQHMLEGIRIAAGRTPADFSGQRVKETIANSVWPVNLAIDDQGNVWIAELTGKVHLYDSETRETRLVGEIETTDPTNIEHGIYGIELDPEFYRGEPYVYIFYAERETVTNTLSRFVFRDGRIDLSTERVLLRVPTEPACCHQAGDLEWGPDGTLFISTGDTGQSSVRPNREISEERIGAFITANDLIDYHWSRIVDSERTAQNLQDLRGKVLRINADGSIPRDNPFYGQPGVRWEIYSYGLRNPYRFEYDAPTGRLYIGVVGPDEPTTYDWYNVAQQGGENFGWPRSNGRLFYNEWKPADIPGYVPPMWEYTYATGPRSAHFGPIYRSTGERAFPAVFQDRVFIFDWSRKWIKWADVVNGTFESDTLADVRGDDRQFSRPAKRLTNIKTFDVLEETNPIAMELGPDGCLYVAEFTGFWGPAPGSNVSRYCWISDEPTGGSPSARGANGGVSADRVRVTDGGR